MSDKTLDDLSEQGHALLEQGKAPDAITLFEQVIEGNADHVRAHEGLAMAHSLSSDWAASEKHFAKLIQLQPMQARHYINLGTMHLRKEDYQKAVDTLRRALQRDRKNARSYFLLGLAYRKLKQTAMAVSAYKESIKITPDFAEAYLNLANVYLDMGSLQQAMQTFKQALILQPNLEKAKKGLEKVQQAIVKAKSSESPFGRLVDVDTRAKAVPTMERELTAEEREVDRREIRIIMESLESLARDCRLYLEGALERKLHEMHVWITSNDRVTTPLEQAADFREAVARWNELRQMLRRKVLELRAHEELMSTPELPAK